LDDAGLRAADLDGIAVYTFVSDYVSAFRIADMIGVPELEYFNTNVDGGAYAMAALTGAAAVASGSCDTCLTLRPIMQATATGASVARQGQESFVSGPNEFLAPFGSISGAQWAGMAMQRTMHEYGFTEQMFGAFAVSQREYAVDNPDALLRTPMTMDDYLSSRYINKPLRLFDCDYPVDSCSGLIFTTEERARDLVHRPVFIDAWAAGGVNPGDFHLVPSMPRSSTYVAARRMWTKTDLQPSDVQIAGLYDGFSFIALQWMEALGLVGEGERRAVRAGRRDAQGWAAPDEHRRRRVQRRPAPRRQLLHRGDPPAAGRVRRPADTRRRGGRVLQLRARLLGLRAAHRRLIDGHHGCSGTDPQTEDPTVPWTGRRSFTSAGSVDRSGAAVRWRRATRRRSRGRSRRPRP
jgi:acetyl-CoA acetyltransferase